MAFNPLTAITSAGRGVKGLLAAAGRNFDRNAAGSLPELMGEEFTPDVRRRARANAIMAAGAALAGQQPVMQGLQTGQQGIAANWAAGQQVKQQREARAQMEEMNQQMAGVEGQGPVQPTPEVLRAKAQQYRKLGTRLMMAGRDDSAGHALRLAQQFEDRADAMAPKAENGIQTVIGPDGKPMLARTWSDGTVRPVEGGYRPRPNYQMVDAGDKQVPVDMDAPGQGVTKSATPDARMVDERSRSQFDRNFSLDERRTKAAEAGAAAARQAAANGMSERGMRAEGDLRGEYMRASQPFVGLRDAWSKISAATANPSPAGDVALIYGFMRILDPGSTVREGEFATAANAGGVGDRIRAAYNKALNGERLSPDMRTDFVKQAYQLYQSANTNQQKLRQEYGGLAGRYGLNPKNVLPDLSPAGGFDDLGFEVKK